MQLVLISATVYKGDNDGWGSGGLACHHKCIQRMNIMYLNRILNIIFLRKIRIYTCISILKLG